MAIFDRLIGLETEYAIRFHPRDPAVPRPSDRQLYERFVAELRSRLPLANAELPTGKQGVFLANGGAVCFERYRYTNDTGLLEGSTPECRGPTQLLAAQRAQDALLAETARDAGGPDEFTLIKNCRDSQGHSYGAQENYEAVLARGWRLRLWRIGICLALPLFVLAIILTMLVMLAVVLVSVLLIAPVYRLATPGLSREDRRKQMSRVIGPQWFTGSPADPGWPAWAESIIIWSIRLFMIPACLTVSGLFMLTDMYRTQRRLLPFLISRTVLAGSGWLDPGGRFHVAEKAESRTRVVLHILADYDRPIYSLGGLFKPCIKAILTPSRFHDALDPRQRLQVSLGDSNMCEEAEYLRFATTLLVLEAIEAGALRDVPVIRRPLHALGVFSRDPSLTATVKIRGGQRMTALQIQRSYLDACRRYIAATPDAPREAVRLLDDWAEVLDKLEADPRQLLGRIDWVTKKFLLDEAGAGAPYEARKKIDLRYHELSDAGYFARLAKTGRIPTLISPELLDKARRMPPPNTAAAERGRLIREFSPDGGLEWVSWTMVRLSERLGSRTIRLEPEGNRG